MNAKQHFDAIQAAEKVARAAHDAVVAAQTAAAELCPIKVGMVVDHTTNDKPCQFEVTDVLVMTNYNSLQVTIHGLKLKKDGSVSNINCYKFFNIPATEV